MPRASRQRRRSRGEDPETAAFELRSLVKGESDDWIAKAITEGGKGVGESPLMPAHTTLTADQVKTLVAYVKQFGGQ